MHTAAAYQTPDSYDSLFRDYYALVRKACIEGGIRDVDEAATHILIRFWERDFLSKYNPTHEVTHKGKTYRTKFSSFVYKFAKSYVRGLRDKEGRQSFVDLESIGEVTELGSCPSAAYEASEHSVEIRECVSQVRTYLATVPKRSPRDRCDLVEVFDLCLIDDKQAKRVKIRDHFGISHPAARNWHIRLFEVITEGVELGAIEVPEGVLT